MSRKKTLEQLHRSWQLSEDETVFDYIYNVMLNGNHMLFIECFKELRLEDQGKFLFTIFNSLPESFDTFAWNKSVNQRCVKSIINLKFKSNL